MQRCSIPNKDGAPSPLMSTLFLQVCTSLLSRLSFLFVKNIVLAPSWSQNLLRLQFSILALRACGLFLSGRVKPSLWQRLGLHIELKRLGFASQNLLRLRLSILALRARGLFLSGRVKPSLWQRLGLHIELKRQLFIQ